ncbi:MAG: GIY-YIG nuclease family protein [Gemmatimonadales bacterium]
MQSAHYALQRVPLTPGYYGIYLDHVDTIRPLLPTDVPKQRLIYIGIATTSLRDRLIHQALRHQSPASFFRSVGAVLGYRPPKGSLVGRKNQQNYAFSLGDRDRIRLWIERHPLVSWVSVEPLGHIEKSLIAEMRPLFNIQRNPEPCELLMNLRQECRHIARTPGSQ